MKTVRLDREAYRTVAPNGVVVLSERVATVRSAAVSIWVRSASAHEPRAKMGIAHMLEHMVFKATERRTAKEIALELEVRGGSLDAYTSRETTAYQARVLDADLERALDVLTDLVRRPLLRQQDLDLERNVILEEISTVQDTPDDLVFDLAAEALWSEHPYGFPILGTRETVGGLSAEDLRALHSRAYVPRNCVIAAAGNLEHERLLEYANLLGWFDGTPADGDPPPPPPSGPAVRGGAFRREKDTAQTHIVFSTDAVRFADPRKNVVLVLANVFGGGMSSRLFQRIREELGLAYGIYSYTTFYRQGGVLGVYVGTQPKTAAQAAQAIREEYEKLATEGLRGAALADAIRQTQGQLVLSIESPTSRMYRLASSEIYGEQYKSLDEMLAEVGALTEDEVCAGAAEFFAPERQTVTWLGPATD
jgi:predicted Zn-dependent peptidase